jgi:hypothetical protein
VDAIGSCGHCCGGGGGGGGDWVADTALTVCMAHPSAFMVSRNYVGITRVHAAQPKNEGSGARRQLVKTAACLITLCSGGGGGWRSDDGVV